MCTSVRESRQPSIMLAWLRSSLKMASPGPTSAGKCHARGHIKETRDRPFEAVVRSRMTADERAGPRPKPFGTRRLRRRLREPHVTRVAEVVVGADVDEPPAVEIDRGSLPAVAGSFGPFEAGGSELVEGLRDPVEGRGQRCGGG
jgi:hypothetical protein